MTFEQFVRERGPGLRAALVAAYGPQIGLDAASEALAYGWEQWARLRTMENPAGYLFRVGQSAARELMREPPSFPVPSGQALPEFEPGLLPALAALTEHQRVCVVLVHGYSWPIVEVARLLDVTHATARTHLQRGMAHLRIALEVHRAD
ncbi:MAG: RNA polymerase sigma factor [Ilumatobacteraceae bacterium]